MSKLRKLLRLNPCERWTLAQAAILLPLTALMLRLVGLRRCQRILSHFASQDSVTRVGNSETTIREALRISHLVGLAVRHGIYPANCLQRSLALWWLLRRRGIQSEMQFGTRKEAGRFEAHAWIEIAGVVLNDSNEVRQMYTAFDRPILLAKTEVT